MDATLETTLGRLMDAIEDAVAAGLVAKGCWSHDDFDPEVLAQAYDDDGDAEICLPAVVFNRELTEEVRNGDRMG